MLVAQIVDNQRQGHGRTVDVHANEAGSALFVLFQTLSVTPVWGEEDSIMLIKHVRAHTFHPAHKKKVEQYVHPKGCTWSESGLMFGWKQKHCYLCQEMKVAIA